MSLKNDWKNWCRTCGKNNLLNPDCYSTWDSLDKDSLEIMRKLTPIETEMNENGNICIDCLGFLNEIVTFSKQCKNITDMYAEINLDFDCDILTVRSRYGLTDDGDDDEDEVIFIKNPFENEDNLIIPNELVKIEIKSEDIQEYVEPEYIFTNSIFPTENHSDTRDISRTDKNKPKPNATSTRNRKRKKGNVKVFRNTVDVLCNKIPYDSSTVTDNNTMMKENRTNGLQSCPVKLVKKKLVALKKTKIKKSIRCPMCNLGFNCQLECESHQTANHSIIDYPFDCLKCPKRFTTEQGLRTHNRIHSTGFKILPKDKDAFVCDQCGKRCSSNANLGEHLSIHSDDYPYECTKCPKKFKHLYRLRRHETTHSDVIFVCDICKLQFKTKKRISAHMVVHSEIKKFKCNFCGNEYKRSRTLKAHLIYHSGLKPYKCPFCDKSFTYGTSCRLHKKTVHPQELAELEASGEAQPFTNLPKLEYLQPK